MKECPRRRLETKYKKRKRMRVLDMRIAYQCLRRHSLYLISYSCNSLRLLSAFTTGRGEETCLCTPCLSSLAYRECASREEISFERCKMIYGAPLTSSCRIVPLKQPGRFGRQNFRGDECRTLQ